MICSLVSAGASALVTPDTVATGLSPAGPLLFLWCAALAALALVTGAQLLAEAVRARVGRGAGRGGPGR